MKYKGENRTTKAAEMEDAELPTALLKSLDKQRRKGSTLCDISLNIDNTEFYAHKCILAVFCPYFEIMFSSSFREETQASISMDKTPLTAESLEIVLNAVYSGRLDVNATNIVDVVVAMDFLLMKRFLPLSEQFLIDHSSQENWFEYFTVAKNCRMTKVLLYIEKMVPQVFLSIYQTVEFKKLSIDSVLMILSSDYLCTNSQEIEVFRALCEWLDENDISSEEICDILTNSKYIDYRHIKLSLIESEILPHKLIQSEKVKSHISHIVSTYHQIMEKQPMMYTRDSEHRGVKCYVNREWINNQGTILVFRPADSESGSCTPQSEVEFFG